ncbi:hypothetical protein AAT19DRAFT_15197 [Rhodotorula toruloides]|uniref:Uncharacterized protein n=1 Tax=Rhodotorula toruloides TaxID=5286 RepID=A0A2T0A6L0_RHOTO|nr:hypothetical protein AAT19DRAFT_15197 [Rhodotorula toruloides]
MQGSDELSLGQLLSRSLRNADKCANAPAPNDHAVQSLITQTLSDLTLCASLISHLGILSPNETVEDISTRNLRCVLVPALQGQLALLVRTKGGVERLEWLNRAKGYLRAFVEDVEKYEVVGEERRGVLRGPGVAEMDPARRRAGKIAQFKMEKEIKTTLEELRTRRRKRRTRGSALPVSSSSSSSSSSTPAPTEELDDYPSSSDDEDATESVARPLLLNLLTLHYIRSHAELGSIEQEIEILEHGMKMSEIPSQGPGTAAGLSGDKRIGHAGEKEKDEEESRWRLDRLPEKDAEPVLSPDGKVLRPFTILPSTSSTNALSTRLRLQSEIFRPSHRLPTMTIDEFLEQEQERGNVLQGGGPKTSDEVEQARKDEAAEEGEDDTAAGYAREEAGLRKKREWDDYTDQHRKGEGNMCVRSSLLLS